MLNNTSNEYDLQSVYNGNGFLGIISDLSQVYSTMYGTTVSPYTYTGSENIDITDNQISLTFPLKINDEVVLNPKACDGAVFEMTSGTGIFAFRQNTIHGGQPITQFHSPTKVCTFHGDCQIPNIYNKAAVDILIADIYNDTYIETGICSLISNIDLSNYYAKSEVDDIDNELSTLILNTYTKAEIDAQITDYATISYLQGNYMTTLKNNRSFNE